MDDLSALQLILPTDKRNPCFSLYQHSSQKEIHVYYGLELLERVPNDPGHSAYKLLAGRLYNAGVKVRVLEDVFEVDRKTMRLFGQALRSPDPEKLQRVLLGRGANRKCTPAVEGFVRHRWPQLVREGCRNYRQRLQEEIREIFAISLSGETLRLLMAKIKDQIPREEPTMRPIPPTGSEPGSEPQPPPEDGAPVVNEAAVGAPEAHPVESSAGGVEPAILEEKGCSSESVAGSAMQPASQCSPPIWSPQPGQTCWCAHAGLLWFAAGLGGLAAAVHPPEPVLAQWLGSVLLGAMNLEQTKYLNLDDLSLVLGSVVRFPTPQRENLKRLSAPETVDGVLRWNLAALGDPEGSDVYLDPHTKHYTGEQNVLKGWCAALRWADKAIHSDFVHTARGEPIYFECVDNFEDLRARFEPLIQRMRASLQWSPERVVTAVVDRGIFGADVFDRVIANPALHLITWEKGYEAEPWAAAQVSGSFALQRCRNRSDDLRLYQFEYLDRPWAKHPKMRQLVVRATNPLGKTVQVAVLTDDLKRAAQEILRLMFRRWLQENDFKYLDKHFGIKELTSYRSVPYEELRDQLTDRQVQSHAYGQLVKVGRDLARQQARVLVVEERARRKEAARQERLKILAKQMENSPPGELEEMAARQELARLRAASRCYENYRKERAGKVEEWDQKLQQNQKDKETAQRDVSRVDQLIEEDRVRMDTRGKRLMDAIKITARNLFYRALAPFKEAYDNYRDDHDLFRQLTLSAGVLRWTGQEMEVHVLPHVNYSSPVRNIIQSLMEGLNEKQPDMPDGSGRKLRFRLACKEEIKVGIQVEAPTA